MDPFLAGTILQISLIIIKIIKIQNNTNIMQYNKEYKKWFYHFKKNYFKYSDIENVKRKLLNQRIFIKQMTVSLTLFIFDKFYRQIFNWLKTKKL